MYNQERIPELSCLYTANDADNSDLELRIHNKNGNIRAKVKLNKQRAEDLITTLKHYLGIKEDLA